MKRFFGAVNLLLILWIVGFGLWAWNILPDEIPLHFGFDGQADRWGGKSFLSWFTAPMVALGLFLLMELFRMVIPHRPNWVNLPDRTKVSDLPEEAQGPVLEFFSGFLAMVQTELLLIFAIIEYASYRGAMGQSTQGLMVLVLIMAVTASPVLITVFFLKLQGAVAKGKEAARRGAAGIS